MKKITIILDIIFYFFTANFFVKWDEEISIYLLNKFNINVNQIIIDLMFFLIFFIFGFTYKTIKCHKQKNSK